MIKKSIVLSLALGVQFFSFAQSSNNPKRPLLTNSKHFEQVEVLYDIAETEGLLKLRSTPIYSKARGLTALSAINFVNNRALKKLTTEATMLGADAVHIVENYQKGHTLYASVYSTYTAVPYAREALTLESVNKLIDGKNYAMVATARYNRNGIKVNTSVHNNNDRHQVAKPFEENGKIYVLMNLYNKTEKMQIVRIDEERVILAQYIKDNKIIENYELRIAN